MYTGTLSIYSTYTPPLNPSKELKVTMMYHNLHNSSYMRVVFIQNHSYDCLYIESGRSGFKNHIGQSVHKYIDHNNNALCKAGEKTLGKTIITLFKVIHMLIIQYSFLCVWLHNIEYDMI